ncbi:MAG: thiol-disulfide isomerase [Pirellulales bacterium]
MKQLALLLLLTVCAPVGAIEIAGRDQHGVEFNPAVCAEDRFTVVAFLNAGCPLGRFYANRLNELQDKYPDVCFVGVNANEGDTYEDWAEFGKRLRFPMVKDGIAADQLGATRSPEVFLLDHHKVIYQGAIDDQYMPGIHSRSATRHYLDEALTEAVNGQPVSIPKTEASGCRIERPKKVKPGPVTYSDVAPIFYRRCAECHRPGQSASFSLLSYRDAAGWSETIRDVLLEKRMPPWGADPRYGHFANDRSLTVEERRLIFEWLDAECPQGDPALQPTPPKFASGWTIKPDLVLEAPKFTVPKEGLLDYQEYTLTLGHGSDIWIKAAEVMPGNRAVVHHAGLRIVPPNAEPGRYYFQKDFSDDFLAMYIPGNTSMTLPPGFAKRIPAGWNIVLSIHYVPTGEETDDQTSVGFTLTDKPAFQIATQCLAPEPFELQPGEVRTVVQERVIDREFLLMALYPHMHLRGKSMLFEATYPDGKHEVLLNVPDYDFEWQHRYVLAKPKVLPIGTTLRCTAVYDNSAANKRNPDATALVKAGERTEDEMFLGIFEFAQPLPQTRSSVLAYVGVAIAVLFLIWRKR